MKYTLKGLAAAAALVLAGTAQAASATFDFSNVFTLVLEETDAELIAVPPSVIDLEHGSGEPGIPYPPRIEGVTSPVDGATLNPSTLKLATVSTAGGFKIELPRQPGFSLGATLGIENLTLDLDSKKVYASITGNFTGVATNAAGASDGAITTIDNFHLWDIQSITGDTTPGPTSSFTASGLVITSGGFSHLVSALRLVNTGRTLFTAIPDYGSITVSAVPEPSSFALTLAGVAAVVAVARARRSRG